MMEEERIGISDEERRQREHDEAARIALEAVELPEVPPSSLEALPTADPEASSATAHTAEGSFADASTEPGARMGPPRTPPTDESLDAERMALAPRPPEAPQAPESGRALGTPATPPMDEQASYVTDAESAAAPPTPGVMASPSPLAAVHEDDSMDPADDSPDALHAMQGQPEAPPDMVISEEDAFADQYPEEPGGMYSQAERAALEGPGDLGSPFAPPTPGVIALPMEDGLDMEPDADEDDPERMALKPAPTEAAPMLDEGLPAEGEIQTARDWDVPRSILRSLQNGLLGAIGRPRREYQGEGDALQARRGEGMTDRFAAKGVERRHETEDAARAAAAEADATQDAEAGRRADEGLDIRRQTLDLARERDASLDESRDATRSRLDSAEERRATESGQSADPSSPASQAERLAFSVARQRLSPDAQQALTDALTSEGIDPSTASAAQLRRANDIIRTIGVRGTRGTGTGGGATRQRLAQQLVDADESGSTTMEAALARVDALGTTGARGHLRHQLEAREEGGTEGEEIFAGVRAGVDISPRERDALREGYRAARAQMASLQTVRDIAGRYGASGRIDPAAAAEMSAPLRRLMSMVATMQNTGVINPGEMAGILEALPDPTSLSQMTFGTLRTRLDGFQRELESGIAAGLDARSVDREGIARVLRGIHGASLGRDTVARRAAPETAPAPGARVRYRTPDGRTATGPAGVTPPEGWEPIDGP